MNLIKFTIPKPTPYNLQIVDQTTTNLMGLIGKLKMYVHGISYVTTFTIPYNSVIDYSYSMLLGRPWVREKSSQ